MPGAHVVAMRGMAGEPAGKRNELDHQRGTWLGRRIDVIDAVAYGRCDTGETRVGLVT